MAILKIARMGHPVLLERCQLVTNPGAPEIRRLVRDMFDTMEDAPGAGLAAPQVHVPLRLFVFRVQPHRSTGVPGDAVVGNTVVINPVVEPLGNQMETEVPRCAFCSVEPSLIVVSSSVNGVGAKGSAGSFWAA